MIILTSRNRFLRYRHHHHRHYVFPVKQHLIGISRTHTHTHSLDLAKSDISVRLTSNTIQYDTIQYKTYNAQYITQNVIRRHGT